MSEDRVEETPTGSVMFEPIFGKVVIEVEASNLRRTASGLYVPAVEASLRTFGVVCAVYEPTAAEEGGPPIAPQVRVGDHVVFGQYTGTEIEIAGKYYIICREQDLLSIVFFNAEDMKDNARKAPERPTNALALPTR